MGRFIKSIGIAIFIVAFFSYAIISASYTFEKCGWKTLFLGKSAFFAAATGMCDNK